MDVCTCSARHDEEHDFGCDLWLNNDFLDGRLAWDHFKQKLIKPEPEDHWTDDIVNKSYTLDSVGQLQLVHPHVTVSPPKTGFTKDRHYHQKVTFPDGSVVHGSSNHTRGGSEPIPQFALYLDSVWRPQCLSFFLPWQDYGLPTNYEDAFHAITEIHRLGKEGADVEIGCIGGHGRTGTALACVATLAGVPVDQAVDWIRENYCKHAVETEKQAWFVQWFNARRLGLEPPPMPEPPKETWNVKAEPKKEEVVVPTPKARRPRRKRGRRKK